MEHKLIQELKKLDVEKLDAIAGIFKDRATSKNDWFKYPYFTICKKEYDPCMGCDECRKYWKNHESYDVDVCKYPILNTKMHFGLFFSRQTAEEEIKKIQKSTKYEYDIDEHSLTTEGNAKEKKLLEIMKRIGSKLIKSGE